MGCGRLGTGQGPREWGAAVGERGRAGMRANEGDGREKKR